MQIKYHRNASILAQNIPNPLPSELLHLSGGCKFTEFKSPPKLLTQALIFELHKMYAGLGDPDGSLKQASDSDFEKEITADLPLAESLLE